MIAGHEVALILAAAVLFCVLVTGWNRYQQRKLLRRLGDLLDAAMDGSFCEQTFDESLMSALESKLARYLASSEI